MFSSDGSQAVFSRSILQDGRLRGIKLVDSRAVIKSKIGIMRVLRPQFVWYLSICQPLHWRRVARIVSICSRDVSAIRFSELGEKSTRKKRFLVVRNLIVSPS